MRAQLPRLVVATTSTRFFSVLATVLVGLLSLPTATGEETAEVPSADASAVSFARDVQPIFAKRCLGCHQHAKPQGDYVMTDFAALLSGGETGESAIVPGDPAKSYLMDQITPVDGVAEMPKQGAPLAAVELEIIQRWIAEGAIDDSPAASGPVYDADHPPVYSRPPSIPSIDISPDGRVMAVAGFHEVILVDPSSAALIGRLVGISERIESVRFSPDGHRLAAAGGLPGRAGEIQIWNVAEQTLELSAPFTHDTLRGVSWSPDGSLVAFGATDNAIRAIDSVSGEQRLFQGAHEDWVLGTAFTAAGDHVVSVARDMTCKLTETTTERFIDNITSITPGALRGGLTSVVRVPEEDQIFVGGADGAAKIYRVFRQSARKIGDDANLVHQLPELGGRIFSVAVSGDGSRFAAAATIDGRSEIGVWQVQTPGEPPEDVRAIQEKPEGDRSDEEKQKLQAFLSPPPVELARLAIDETAIYAICFAPDDSLVAAGADGQIRMLSPSGEIQRMFVPVPVLDASEVAATAAFDPAAWAETVAATTSEGVERQPLPSPEAIAAIEVSPQEIRLGSPFAYAQLAITAHLTSGDRIDVTRSVEIEAPEVLSVTPEGLARPLATGDGMVQITAGAHRLEIPVHIDLPSADAAAAPVDFIRDVNPMLSRLGCNQGTCHGSQKGRNGFKLSLRGYDPLFDVRALTDDLAARRVDLASPEDSLMLLKALGRVPHQGGALIDAGSPYHGILRGWITQGASLEQTSTRAARIEVQPQNPVVGRSGAQQQVRVIAYYDDGTERDVTHEAYVESGNTEIATVSKTGLLTSIRRGEAPILARYEGSYAATTLTVMGERDEFIWQSPEVYGQIDRLVADKWERMKILPSELCDDATFLRRVYLDLTGLPPTSAQTRAFLADERPTQEKREEVVDLLIGSPPFVEHWTNKWADLLQVNRKFLGPEGAAQFREWIEAAVVENRPYDQFAQEILTSTGSNKDNPAASYYKILRTPEDTMENTTHLFLGIRFNCNKCHDHPFERWTQDQYYETASFFARTSLRPDPAAGDAKIGGSAVEDAKPLYEEVFDADQGDVTHPTTGAAVDPVFPYDCDFEVADDATRRQRLAGWMTSPDNPYFARSYANRLWGYLMGAGLIEPIDDIRAGNPPTNPELLDYLAEEFVDSGFDSRHLLRMICTSRVYQLSVATNRWNADDTLNYSHAQPRRLPAEVLFDAIHFVTGAESHIPGVPAGTRAASLPDVGIQSADGFLANLGRPVRESACECERSSELQLGPIMALVSGPTVGTAIADDANDLAGIVNTLEDDAALVDELFVRILNRPPSSPEIDAFRQALESIDDDHQLIEERLAEREQWWNEELPQREMQQAAAIAAASEQLASLAASLKPERDRLEQDRQERIAAAQAALQTAESSLKDRIPQWAAEHADSPEWFVLRPNALEASQGAQLKAESDRAIRASGSAGPGVYTVTVDTRLRGITGFRFEALPVDDLPGGGPGLPENGNFVVTEFEVSAGPLSDPASASPAKIAAGKADFAQDSFAIEQTFDGNSNDQRGWAVSPAGGIVHWATFQLAEPIDHQEGTRITFKIHQFHSATDHRLARFRLSATTDEGPIALGLAESLAAAVAIPEAARGDDDLRPLLQYLSKMDGSIRDARQALTAAQTPIPDDPGVVAMRRSIEELSKPIPIDATLLSLRTDAEQSKQQLQNVRLTAAEDLVWALINSPAFLFNR